MSERFETIWMCPVCGKMLYSGGSLSLQCENHHNFDRAKKGALYLLPPNRKHTGNSGDNPEMVQARRHFLQKGYYSHLLETLCMALDEYFPMNGILLDAGCGEGYYTSGMRIHLQKQGISSNFYGVDISKTASNYASKADSLIRYAVASVFHLPVLHESCDMVVSIFAPYCGEEFQRVLKQGGFFMMAIPSAKHLWKLKQAIYDKPYENEVKDYSLDGFTFLKKYACQKDIFLDNHDDIQALFEMTPYAYRTSPKEKERLSSLDSLTTETAFEVLIYQKVKE